MYTTTDEHKKEFYFYLGLLSTKYASLEYYTLLIVSLLIVDNFIITQILIERNSLQQNLDLLKRINKYRNFEKDRIIQLTNKINEIKKHRNLFIHGIWQEPKIKKNEMIIKCLIPKIMFDENEKGTTWVDKTSVKYTLTEIKNIIESIDLINIEQEELLAKLHDTSFE